MNRTSEPVRAHDTPWRASLYKVIFEAETPAGKNFDVVLLWAILISVIAVLLESVQSIGAQYGATLRAIEWILTILFSIEYLVRCLCVKKPFQYMKSFLGVIDFFAIIPTFLSLIMIGAQSLLVIRALRLLRVFRVLKLGRYLKEFNILIKALKSSYDKIMVFLFSILTLTLIAGTVMYLVEGESSGFTSIPRSIYWAIVTMTTVGYGDIAPKTVLGQCIASIIMILGYAIIVVPTGIFSVALTRATLEEGSKKYCPHCKISAYGHDAYYCRICGTALDLG